MRQVDAESALSICYSVIVKFIPQDGTSKVGLALSDSSNLAADKLLRTLSAFTFRHTWDLANLAHTLGFPKSTTHRLLRDLCRHGYLRQVPDTPHYTIGYRLAILADSISPASVLREAVRAPLEHLASATGETASFIVLDGIHALVLEVVESPSALRFALRAGARFPLHRGSAGRILLAFGASELRQQALESVGVEEQTALQAELGRAMEQGWAYTADEVNLGAAAIAVPVISKGGALVGSLAAGGPVGRMGLEIALQVLPDLQEQARALALELG